jgi:metal-sulfur cluster biosynthetic enzyme
MAEKRYEDRTDSIQEKLRLIQNAHAAGNYELVQSLSESIKATAAYERQAKKTIDAADVGAQVFSSVDELPSSWAQWASGWAHCKPVTLFETVGIARVDEPVDLTIGFRADQTTDLQREVRVVHVDLESGALLEVMSQVYEETRRVDERVCHVVFLADVSAHGRGDYLIFYGNPNAELPEYPSDLQCTGDGYALNITNNHYEAQLSEQVGQLERLTIRRQHKLELYAGGKGHGETPHIDWAHDYVDQAGFQKFRINHWAECPNYEIFQGPLCVRVRRWGFPHSPVHPLFTPSRMHVDVTYAFYARAPYFIKEGQMDAVKDFEIAAMRDDEWVFSGYSFTNLVWVDSQGKLHNGPVPPEQANSLWGIGFYHDVSRDAFVALFLDHRAEQFGDIQHSGSPTLDYPGHGQLWSRYPVYAAELKAGTSFQQRNAYFVSPYPKEDAAGMIEQNRHRLMNALAVHAGEVPHGAQRAVSGSLARPGEIPEAATLKSAIWETLKKVKDDQLYTVDANVVDLGYVYDVRVRNGVATIVVTMPHRGRPHYMFLVTQGGGRLEDGIREHLLKLEGIKEVIVEFTWNPGWTIARLTDAGRSALGLPS